jgi:hypothetical protein
VKKWCIGVLVFLLLVAFIVWATRPSKAFQVVTYGGFKVYDVQYFPKTNRVYYWRCAWRDALGLVGLKKDRDSQPGPALVIYSSTPGVGGKANTPAKRMTTRQQSLGIN